MISSPSCFCGGLVSLVPYMMTDSTGPAIKISVLTSGFALLIFGTVKGQFTGLYWVCAALQTLVGGWLAAAAFGVAHAFG